MAHGRRSRIGAARQHHAKCPAGSAALAPAARTPIAGDTADLLLREAARCECCASRPRHIGFRAVAENRMLATAIWPLHDGCALVRPVTVIGLRTHSFPGFQRLCSSFRSGKLRGSRAAKIVPVRLSFLRRDTAHTQTDLAFCCCYWAFCLEAAHWMSTLTYVYSGSGLRVGLRNCWQRWRALPVGSHFFEFLSDALFS